MAGITHRRLRELDFLRGVAILLVLLRHQPVSDVTHRMGWIGVDLFFVLSGFLVSGLLFREFQKFQDIKPGLFLIRRGFKIYPVYYLTYLIYLVIPILKNKLSGIGVLCDVLFIQNYTSGWGYLYAPSWSLAVEEHFYLLFCLFLFLTVKYKPSFLYRGNSRVSPFEIMVFCVAVVCLLLRTYSNMAYPDLGARLVTMTHLRIDSLLSGTLIAYWFYFHRERFKAVFDRYGRIMLWATIPLLSFTPFIEYTESVFALTIGFLLLTIAFGILLSWFVTSPSVNQTLDSLFSRRLVNAVSRIGYFSYFIYVIHSLVNYAFALGQTLAGIRLPAVVLFFATSLVSILLGWFGTTFIESFFLRMRDRHFPSRVVSGV